MRLRLSVLTALACSLAAVPALAADTLQVDPAEHIRGNAKAQVSIIEYSDFECPFCRRHVPTMKLILRKYRGKVNWVYRPFPLSAIHPNAMDAAEAGECVAELKGNDAFWKFHDLLFRRAETNGGLTAALIPAAAKSVGTRKADFDACMKNDRHLARIEAIVNAGTEAGVSGTPANFVVVNKTGEWETVMGAVPAETISEVVDRAFKNKLQKSEPYVYDPQPSYPAPVPVPEPQGEPPALRANDHVRGSPSAPIAMIVYGGVGDPFSRKHHQTLKLLYDKYNGKKPGTLQWIARHYPLSFQPDSQRGAEGMECALEQKGEAMFWSVLFDLYWRETPDPRLSAADWGLDLKLFDACMASGRAQARIQADLDLGTAAGVDGTPTTFILHVPSGQWHMISGAMPIDSFETAIDNFLGR